MKKVLITFSGAQYDGTTKDLVELGPKFGADEVWVYDDVWLTEHPFYKMNRWLWDHPHKRGFGWYAWKPVVILDALHRLKDGDVVMFVDADCRPVANFSVLFDECARAGGVMLFAAETYNQREWCKKDCMVVMDQDEDRYRDVPHAVARFMLFEKGKWAPFQILMEWLTYNVNPKANTFDMSILEDEYFDLIEHRAEQAILTNLAHKYGIKLYREMDDGGEVPTVFHRDRELYPKLFVQENPNNDVDETRNKSLPAIGSQYRNV